MHLTPEQERELHRIATLGYVAGSDLVPETTGVLHSVPGATFDGNTLFTCAFGSEAFLIDMTGDVVHSWRLAGYEYWARAHLYPNGDLIAITVDPSHVIKLDGQSRPLWRYEEPAHHDFDVLADGRIAVLVRNAVTRPNIHDGTHILDDNITLLDPEGRELKRVSLLTAFERSEDYASWLTDHELPGGPEIFHTNSVEVFERDGAMHALISIRALDTIAIVNMESERVVWAVDGPWHMQHEAGFVDWNILLFDNLGLDDRSRLLEIDVNTLEVVWSYEADGFFTRGAGAQQRLPNGNTLVVESESGRIFEISADGEVLWDYINPRTLERGGRNLVLGIMRAERIPAGFPMDWARQPGA